MVACPCELKNVSKELLQA